MCENDGTETESGMAGGMTGAKRQLIQGDEYIGFDANE